MYLGGRNSKDMGEIFRIEIMYLGGRNSKDMGEIAFRREKAPVEPGHNILGVLRKRCY